MIRRNSASSVGCGAMVTVMAVVLAVHFIIGGFLVKYSADYWGTRLSGHKVEYSRTVCGFVAIPLAEVALPVAAVTWLVKTAD